MSNEDIHLLFDMALKGVNDLLRSQDARLVLEMLLLRMASAPTVVHLAQLLSGSLPASSPGPITTAAMTSAPTQPVPQTAIPTAAPERKFNFVRQVNPGAAPYQPQASPQATSVASSVAAPAVAAPTDEEASGPHSNDPWFQFVRQIKKSNALLGAMLENTHILSNEGTHLVLGVPKKVGFLTDKLKDPENIKRIQTFLETFWNKRYTVEIKVDTPAKGTSTSAQTQATEQLTPRAAITQQQQVNEKSLEQAIETNPLVRSAQDVFKGQIKSIKERK
jgi:DNA polymerase-3 subunit gamma/tau